MPNYVLDPSFETGVPWNLFLEQCNVEGGSYSTAEFRTGLRSLRILSRNVGPTCGGAKQDVAGLHVFQPHLMGVWWKGTGLAVGAQAQVILGNYPSGTILITGSSASWKLAFSVVYPQTPTDLFEILQIPAAGTNIRFFDDAFLLDVQDPDVAALVSQAGKATGARISAAIDAALSSKDRFGAAPASLSAGSSTRAPQRISGMPGAPAVIGAATTSRAGKAVNSSPTAPVSSALGFGRLTAAVSPLSVGGRAASLSLKATPRKP
jgi:hypothetical protein